MRSLTIQPVISMLLFVALFAGLQGGRYVFSNRLQEIGTLCVFAVFAIGAWIALFRISAVQWQRWVLIPSVLIVSVMLMSALTFSLNFSESVLFSFFAAREFLIGFIGPAIVLIVRSGYPMESLKRVLLSCFLALLVNYLYHYNTMDLRAAFFSPDHTISNLVTYDEWRGFRLKPSMVAVMLSMLVGLMMCFQKTSFSTVVIGLLLVSLSAYIWSIVMFRSTLATMMIGIVVYFTFLSARNRIPLICLSIPLVLILVPIVAQVVMNHFSQADGGALRLKSYTVAINVIPQYFFFGVGEDSAFGQTYQDLFGRTFFPSDIGIVGIFFKYGVVGLLLYVYMHLLILSRLWRANLSVKEQTGRHDPILWGLLILMTAQSLNLVLIAGLGYAQGIATGALSLGYAALCLDMYSREGLDERSQNAVNSLQNATHTLQIATH